MPHSRGVAAAITTLSLMVVYGQFIHPSIVRAQSGPQIEVKLIVNGRPRKVATTALRVDSLLDRVGQKMAPGDLLTPPPAARTFDGMTVQLNRAEVRMETHHHTVPFKTRYQRTVRILPGRKVQLHPGRNGINEEKVLVHYFGGKVTSRSIVKITWLRKPVDQETLLGTDPFVSSRGLGGLGRCLHMRASMYDIWLGGQGSGRTRTGIRARRGIVAVDPRVIPLGTRLYVEGYGYCLAADTGGAIKRDRIDLCVPSKREADRYGIHRVRVYVLR